MNNTIKITTQFRLALLLGALGLVAVACSDDDDSANANNGGSGGTSAGKSNGGSTNGGSSAGKGGGGTGSAGKSNGGTSNAGTSNAGTSNGGTSTAGASNNAGAAGADTSMAGESMGGSGAMGGQAGDGLGGAAQAGAGGAPNIQPDVLDNPGFLYEDGTQNWKEEGDVDASTFKWIHDSEPGLNHYAATAFKVATLQTVAPLPNGTYSFSLEIQRAADLNDQYLFARGCTAGDPTGQVTQSTAAAGPGGYTTITLSNIEVTSGSCTVGIYTDALAGGWANIDNAVFGPQ